MEKEIKLFIEFDTGDNHDLEFWNLDTIENDMMLYFGVVLDDVFKEHIIGDELVNILKNKLKEKVSGMISEYFLDYRIELVNPEE